jgi:hypothetical protein
VNRALLPTGLFDRMSRLSVTQLYHYDKAGCGDQWQHCCPLQMRHNQAQTPSRSFVTKPPDTTLSPVTVASARTTWPVTLTSTSWYHVV